VRALIAPRFRAGQRLSRAQWLNGWAARLTPLPQEVAMGEKVGVIAH